MEWSRKTGQPPPGSPGSIFGGGDPPRIEIQLRDTTVRGVLDGFALYTVAHANTDPTANPPYRPLGWRVDFTPDPQAPTGLDGYLTWRPFP